MSNYQDSRQQRENRRRTIVRVVCVVIAVAMLGSLIIPAIYAGLSRCLRIFVPAVEHV